MRVPTCRLCESEHWSYEPHVIKGVSVRPAVAALLAPKPVTPVTKVQTEKLVTKVVTGCRVCGGVLPTPKRGTKPTYCSAKCRVKASRASPRSRA